MEAWQERQEREFELIGNTPTARVYVFTREDGNPIHPDYVTRHFEWLVRRAGVPPVRLHDLRHGAALLTYLATKDLKAVQSLLGHSQISITADTYTSLFEDTERDAAEAVAALVPRATPRPAGDTTRAERDIAAVVPLNPHTTGVLSGKPAKQVRPCRWPTSATRSLSVVDAPC